MQTTLEINGNQVPVKNLNKLFWPQDGYRKADIMRYYSEVWPYLNPHLRDRPVSLVRYPEGIAWRFFLSKRCPATTVMAQYRLDCLREPGGQLCLN